MNHVFSQEMRAKYPQLAPVAYIAPTVGCYNSPSLGCHTGGFNGVSATIQFNAEFLKAASSKDSWGNTRYDIGKQHAVYEEIAKIPEILEILYTDVYQLVNQMQGLQFILASDNLEFKPGTPECRGQLIRTSMFVEWLVKTKKWGCVASHIGVNANHADPMPHHCQVWILTAPGRKKWMLPGTAWIHNMDDDDLGNPREIYNFKKRQAEYYPSWRKYAWFWSGSTNFPFADIILPQIKRLFRRKKIPGNFYPFKRSNN